MVASGKRKKSKKPAVKARKVAKPRKAKKAAVKKKVKAAPVKPAKRPKKKTPKRAVSSRTKAKVSEPTVEQIAPSGEPEFVSNAQLLKL
jgi:hypothetical protein